MTKSHQLLKIILFSVIYVFSFLTHAQQKCRSAQSQEKSAATSPVKTVEMKISEEAIAKAFSDDPNVSVAQMEEILSVYKFMAAQVSGFIKLPPVLNFKIFDRNDTGLLASFKGLEPVYDNHTNTVFLPSRYFRKINGVDVLQSSRVTLGVQMHEIGHALFEIALAEYSPKSELVKKQRQELDSLTEKSTELSKKSNDLLKNRLKPKQNDEYNRLWSVVTKAAGELNKIDVEILKLKTSDLRLENNMRNTLDAQRSALKTHFENASHQIYQYLKSVLPPEDYNQYFEIVSQEIKIRQQKEMLKEVSINAHGIGLPYAEFIADAFAVILSHDPQIIALGLDSPGNLAGQNIRDFSLSYDLESIPTDIIDYREFRVKTTDPYGRVLVETTGPMTMLRWYMPHNILDGVRGHIWNQYMMNPAYNGKPGYILRALVIAAAKETEYQLTTPELYSPNEMNEGFIRKIDWQMSLGNL
jgi:hypothetical protein